MPSGSCRSLCGPGPKSGPPSPASAPVRGAGPLYSLPLHSRMSLTRRMGRGAARARRDGRRKTPPAALLRGRRRRERELFLQETAFRNSDSISWHTDTWWRGGASTQPSSSASDSETPEYPELFSSFLSKMTFLYFTVSHFISQWNCSIYHRDIHLSCVIIIYYIFLLVPTCPPVTRDDLRPAWDQ